MATQTNSIETQVEKPNWLLNALFGVPNWGGVVKILPGFLLSVAIMLVAIPHERYRRVGAEPAGD